MAKLVFLLFHDEASSLGTVPALAERIYQAQEDTMDLELYVFGAAQGMLSATGQTEFNAQIDSIIKQGLRVTACIGLAQKSGAEAALPARGITLESAALAFPRFAAEAATVMSF